MSLTLYRRHTSKCSQGRSRHERSFESDELRRGFKRCQCPIQFEGKVKAVGFVRKSTEKTSWEEARDVVASWLAKTGVVASLEIPVSATKEPVAPVPEKNEPVTINYAAAEFLADIEARQMDESTRRKYRTMLKQLRAYADQFGFSVGCPWRIDKSCGDGSLEQPSTVTSPSIGAEDYS